MSLSNSSHLPLSPYSNRLNPVRLPPGRARLSTYPAPTGSITVTNTIGTVRVVCCNALVATLAEARMTSGASATSSAAYLRVLPASVPQRVSMRALRPSVQPNCCSACTNAVLRACPSGSSAAKFMNTPMRRTRSACCARAARGQRNEGAAAALAPISAMNSRRFIRTPRRRVRAGYLAR